MGLFVAFARFDKFTFPFRFRPYAPDVLRSRPQKVARSFASLPDKAKRTAVYQEFIEPQKRTGLGQATGMERQACMRGIQLNQTLRCLLAAGALSVSGFYQSAAADPPTSAADIESEMQTIRSLWREKKISEAVRVLRKRVASPEFGFEERHIQASYFYDLACGVSLQGKPEEAVAFLGMAVGNGFNDFDQLKSDDLDPIRKHPGFLVVQEIIRARNDYLAILRQHSDYASNTGTNSLTFAYQSEQDTNLTRFRKIWKLEFIAGNGDDVSRVLNLLHWVHSQVRHDGSSANPQPCNALNLLEVCQKEGRGINCRMMATILNEACLALGYKSRHITCLPLDPNDGDCHVITAVWLEGLQKWVYLDPTYEAYFTDSQGILLSIPEVRARMIKGEPLLLSKNVNWNGRKKHPDEYLAYMAKNLVRLRCPQQSSFGYESAKGNKHYVELDDVSVALKNTAHLSCTHDSAVFWARP